MKIIQVTAGMYDLDHRVGICVELDNGKRFTSTFTAKDLTKDELYRKIIYVADSLFEFISIEEDGKC